MVRLAMGWGLSCHRLLCTDFLVVRGRWRRNPCRQHADAADCGSSNAIFHSGDPAGMIAIALTYKSEVADSAYRKTDAPLNTTWRSR